MPWPETATVAALVPAQIDCAAIAGVQPLLYPSKKTKQTPMSRADRRSGFGVSHHESDAQQLERRCRNVIRQTWSQQNHSRSVRLFFSAYRGACKRPLASEIIRLPYKDAVQNMGTSSQPLARRAQALEDWISSQAIAPTS